MNPYALKQVFGQPGPLDYKKSTEKYSSRREIEINSPDSMAEP